MDGTLRSRLEAKPSSGKHGHYGAVVTAKLSYTSRGQGLSRRRNRLYKRLIARKGLGKKKKRERTNNPQQYPISSSMRSSSTALPHGLELCVWFQALWAVDCPCSGHRVQRTEVNGWCLIGACSSLSARWSYGALALLQILLWLQAVSRKACYQQCSFTKAWEKPRSRRPRPLLWSTANPPLACRYPGKTLGMVKGWRGQPGTRLAIPLQKASCIFSSSRASL